MQVKSSIVEYFKNYKLLQTLMHILVKSIQRDDILAIWDPVHGVMTKDFPAFVENITEAFPVTKSRNTSSK